MIDRTTLPHAALASICCIAAAVAWVSPGERNADQPTLLDIQPEDVSEISWADETHEVVMQRAPEGWKVSVTPKPKDEVPGEEGKASKQEPPITAQWRGSESVTQVLQRLFPLKAERQLPETSGLKAEELQLSPPLASLAVTLASSDETLKVDFGGTTFGIADRYARRGTGYFLVSSKTISPLRGGAPSLWERRVLTSKLGDISRVKVKTPAGFVQEYVHRRDDDGGQGYFAFPSTPDRAVAGMTKLMGQVAALKAEKVGPIGQRPRGTPLSIEFVDHDGQVVEYLELWQVGSSDALGSVATRSAPSLLKVSAAALKPVLEGLSGGVSGSP